MNPTFGGRLIVVNNTGLGSEEPSDINISVGHSCGDREGETVMSDVVLKPWRASDVYLFITEKGEDDYWSIHFSCETNGESRTYDVREVKANYGFDDDGGVMIINLRPSIPGSNNLVADLVFPHSSNVKVLLTSH